MADDWVERRQRALKCPIHGLHYDPKMMAGCPKCRKENITKAPRRRPQVLIFLLSILGLAIVFYRMFGPDGVRMKNLLATDDFEIGTAPIAAKLDPDVYRSEIEAMEDLLFDLQDDSLAKVGGDLLGRATSLSTKIRGREPITRRKAADAIDELISPLADEPLDTERLEAYRSTWPRIRATYFDWADWYASPREEDVLYVELTVYRDVAEELWSLLSEGQNAVARLGEPIPPGFDADKRRAERDAEWVATSQSLRERLQALRERLPGRPPADAEARLMLAIQKLEQALGQADTFFRDAALPAQANAAKRFAAPLLSVEESRTDLNTLLQTP